MAPEPTSLTAVCRRKERASYDEQIIFAIIDEAILSSVAISIDDQPHVVPMMHIRLGRRLYLHGSAGNRTLTHIGSGKNCCINIAIPDGLLLGAKVPDHSLNYRSVTIYGRGALVTELPEKLAIMERFFSSLVQDRWNSLPPLDEEYLGDHTQVVQLSLEESVAKINDSRPAPAMNPKAVWTGILPIEVCWGPPNFIPTNSTAYEAEAPPRPNQYARKRRE